MTKNLKETANKWSGDIVSKTHPMPGTFTKDANTIVNELLRVHHNSPNKSLMALNFYINRAGEKLTNEIQLELAKSKLERMIAEK